MITTLQAFLIESAKEEGKKTIHLNGRLSKESFVIRGLTVGEWEQTRKRALNPSGKGGDRVDGIELTKQTIIAGCIDPNFKDEEFIKSCGCITPSDLIDKVLLAGEATQLSKEIMKASGFDVDEKDLEKAREEAKN